MASESCIPSELPSGHPRNPVTNVTVMADSLESLGHRGRVEWFLRTSSVGEHDVMSSGELRIGPKGLKEPSSSYPTAEPPGHLQAANYSLISKIKLWCCCSFSSCTL